MTQDFATTQRPQKKKLKKRSNKGKSQYQSRVPAWVLVVTSLALGAFVMFLVYLSDYRPSIQGGIQTPPSVEEPRSDIKKGIKPIFEFYDYLLNHEETVDVEVDQSTPAEPVIYILQVASFRDYKEADSLKALLTLEGLSVDIEESVNNKITWYRLMAGPYDTRSKMAKARSMLAQHDLTPMVLKKKIPQTAP